MSVFPRASASRIAASAPRAATSAALRVTPPNEIRSTRSATSMTSAVTAASATAIHNARHVKSACSTTRPPGAPRWRASRAPAPLPAIQPAMLETTVIAATSAAVTSRICPRRAPNHVSRRRVASWSRRSRVDARTAKPRRRTAASPPRTSRRSPATRLVARTPAMVSRGACTEKMSLFSSSCDCALSMREPRRARSQSWTDLGESGTTHPYVRAIKGASGRGVRASPATPSASRMGGRFDPAAAK